MLKDFSLSEAWFFWALETSTGCIIVHSNYPNLPIQVVMRKLIKANRDEFLLPVLAILYPILALLSNNIEDIEPKDALRTFIVMVIGSIGLFLVLAYGLKDKRKSAIITSIFALLFLSYGHFYALLKPLAIGDYSIGRHRYLIPVWISMFVFIYWRVAKSRSINSTIISTGIVIGLVAVLFPLYQIITSVVLQKTASETIVTNEIAEPWLEQNRSEPLPDVYYIILDGYPREDVLLSEYQYDNTGFIRNLETLGFTIAEESKSNYSLTALSIASSLNMNYLDALLHLPESENSRYLLEPYIKDSRVRNLFEQMGYKIVAFESGYGYTEIENADLYLEPGPVGFAGLQGLTGLSAFEMMILETSVGRVVLDGTIALPRFLKSTISLPYRIHRERIVFTLDALEKIPDVPGPKFVFAHIDSPHPPYVFGPEGELIENTAAFTLREDAVGWTISNPEQAFVNQIKYLNSRIIPMLELIITESDIPPIVILQADHGGFYISNEDRMKILNAFFLPPDSREEIYDQISPVNTFRILFNNNFGASFEIIDDVSYFSSSGKPYVFTVIP